MHRRPPALALLATLGWLALPGSAVADCQPAASVEEALAGTDVAFVGTVIAVVEGQPGAGFKVEEVWVGTVAATVQIAGMGDGAGLMEDDRLWRAGARYLVIPYRGEGGELRDNICTATMEWQPELAALRPAGAAEVPATNSESNGFPIVPIVVVAVLIAGLAAFAIGPRQSDRTRGG